VAQSSVRARSEVSFSSGRETAYPPRLYGNFNGHGYSAAFLAKYGSRGLARRFISPDNVPAENTRLCLLLLQSVLEV